MAPPIIRNLCAAAIAALTLFAATACADRIPTLQHEPRVDSILPNQLHDCRWVPWSGGVLPLSDWFQNNPDVAALYRWNDEVAAFETAWRDGPTNPSFVGMKPDTVTWRARDDLADAPITAWGAEAEHLVTLQPGWNLIRWSGGDSDTRLIDLLRWLPNQFSSLAHWDSSDRACRLIAFETPADILHLEQQLLTTLDAGDLLGLKLSNEATWTQSWNHHPQSITLGDIPTHEYRELREEIISVTGFFAARFGREADSYGVVLIESLSAFRRITGSELDSWPDYACAVGGQSGVTLLMNCQEPIAFDHEYLHVLQDQAAGRELSEPRWFIEGMAMYLAARYRHARHHEDYSEARQTAVSDANDATDGPPTLSRIESATDWHELDDRTWAYATGWLAAEWLAARAGDDSLFDFAAQMGELPSDADWPTVFESVFGITIRDFYDEFADHQLSYPEPLPYSVTGRLRAADDSSVANLRIYAYPVHGGYGLYAMTDDDGVFSIDLPSGSYLLSLQSESRCTFYGNIAADGALTLRDNAASFSVEQSNLTGLTLLLPGSVSAIRGWSTCAQPDGDGWLSGVVLDPLGIPVEGVEVLACAAGTIVACARAQSQADGAYALNAPPGALTIMLGPDTCRRWGWRGRDGVLVTDYAQAQTTAIGWKRVRDVDIQLPAPPQQLRSVNVCW